MKPHRQSNVATKGFEGFFAIIRAFQTNQIDQLTFIQTELIPLEMEEQHQSGNIIEKALQCQDLRSVKLGYNKKATKTKCY